MSAPDKLELCPFCGGEGVVITDQLDDAEATCGFRVECDGCAAKTGLFDIPADAIAAWNRRPAQRHGSGVEGMKRIYYWLGWLFCEFAFKTDMFCSGWAYRLGNWFYGKAIALDDAEFEPYPTDDGATS